MSRLYVLLLCAGLAACRTQTTRTTLHTEGGLSVPVGRDNTLRRLPAPVGDVAYVVTAPAADATYTELTFGHHGHGRSNPVPVAHPLLARMPQVSPRLRRALLAQRRLLERQDPDRTYVIGERAVTTRHFLEVIDRLLLDSTHSFVPEAIPVASRGEVHFTGYFSPDLPASRKPTARFRYPLLRAPGEDSLRRRTRAEIAGGERFDLERHALAWVEHPLDVYLMQLQGSGYVTFADGAREYLGFDRSNGRPFTPVARALADSDYDVPFRDVRSIRAWMAEDLPKRARLLDACENYVYFRKAASEATGAGGVPLTAMVSVAADPDHYPLGAVLLAEVPLPGNSRVRETRILLVQDVGAAIKGRGRLDLYTGIGADALDIARLTSEVGEVYMLAPQA